MATRFNGIINVDNRDSVPDWTPFEPPKSAPGAPDLDSEREAAAMLARE